MDNPIISWYIYDNDEYIQEEDYYLGSYNSNSQIQLNIQVWNNRYGSKEVETIKDTRFVVFFDNIEDAALLKYCSISIDNSSFIEPEIELDRAIFNIGELSGQINDGLETDNNKINYKNICLLFSDFDGILKNGLKNMYLDIEIN